MQKEKRSRRRERRRQGEHLRPWLQVEYVILLITLAAALIITGGGVANFVRAGIETSKDRRESAANEQEYVTFFRHVINGAGVRKEETEEESALPQLDVDLTQFADDKGYGGKVYALLEKYPNEVETILTWYEKTSIYQNDAWTTVGEAYPELAIPERLLQLVINNEETISVVAGYPSREEEPTEADLSGELNREKVPLFLQWDPRWGFEEYGDGMICYTGCGPTCLAMVAFQLLQDTSVTPKTVADFADRAGYYTDGVGSAWTLMGKGCEHFGLTAEEISVSERKMEDRLAQGKPLICAVGKGDFTQSGHFIVLTGYENGSFTVNDPNSKVRSAQTWTFQQLSGQLRNIWAMSVDNSAAAAGGAEAEDADTGAEAAQNAEGTDTETGAAQTGEGAETGAETEAAAP